MISNFIGWIFALLVVDPLQAEIQQQAERARLPVEIVRQSQACLTSQGPKLIERAAGDYGWAAATVVSIAIGHTAPAELLDGSDPQCLVGALKGAGAGA
ncbi:hypothetical protein [Rhizobium leguminosarum]|uniref:hypothetical protein n=1 Tax=Rhizobium leguminosarum TaxID=384 RepID=UPI001C900FEE|nr:hypothetical protein [Rhizobium leguminosarum]MBY2913378.1 hypothetical protein [Rhizobium leguminosarum]MBY2932153.1 hypothetical protein [Rhizobium leguminosarum]MBY2965972.1 hypothetical protein [Rhizobium leguminosarum]MBY2968915.1 hypothetical protein [Rhizobium leguminosarum]MBY2976289.1 hypothetical protein [Rhizobium leguminosarum]